MSENLNGLCNMVWNQITGNLGKMRLNGQRAPWIWMVYVICVKLFVTLELSSGFEHVNWNGLCNRIPHVTVTWDYVMNVHWIVLNGIGYIEWRFESLNEW